MQHYQARQSTQTFNVLVIFIFAVVVLQGIAVAKHQQKTYPESGKVIAGGLNQLTVDGPAMGSAGGSVCRQNILTPTRSRRRREFMN